MWRFHGDGWVVGGEWLVGGSADALMVGEWLNGWLMVGSLMGLMAEWLVMMS